VDYIAHDCPRIKINQFYIICLINAFHKHLNKLLSDKIVLENIWLFYSNDKGYSVNVDVLIQYGPDQVTTNLIFQSMSGRLGLGNVISEMNSDLILYYLWMITIFCFLQVYLFNVSVFNVFRYIINVIVIDILAKVFYSPWKLLIFFRYANTTTNVICNISLIDSRYSAIISI